MTRALLLDLDGTLADSLPVMRAAYGELCREMGFEGSDAEFDLLNGPPLLVCAAMLKQRHVLAAAAEDMVRRWFEIIEARYLSCRPAPGAAELLETAAAHGWNRCLVTSSSRKLAGAWLRSVGFETLVPLLVAGDEVPRGKPHPDAYLAALALTGAEAGRSLAVEDSPAGATAALAAGIPTRMVGAAACPPGAAAIAGLAALLPEVSAP
jgi:HAD superfamily hydrolase (TIGR01509 family)